MNVDVHGLNLSGCINKLTEWILYVLSLPEGRRPNSEVVASISLAVHALARGFICAKPSDGAPARPPDSHVSKLRAALSRWIGPEWETALLPTTGSSGQDSSHADRLIEGAMASWPWDVVAQRERLSLLVAAAGELQADLLLQLCQHVQVWNYCKEEMSRSSPHYAERKEALKRKRGLAVGHGQCLAMRLQAANKPQGILANIFVMADLDKCLELILTVSNELHRLANGPLGDVTLSNIADVISWENLRRVMDMRAWREKQFGSDDEWKPAAYYKRFNVADDTLRQAAAKDRVRHQKRDPGNRRSRNLYWDPDVRREWPRKFSDANDPPQKTKKEK